MKKAFTLIELLVVVLIIGILSAIALPQYTKAVKRSRGTQIMTLGRSLADAANRYYLENGSYDNLRGTSSDGLNSLLDVDIPEISMGGKRYWPAALGTENEAYVCYTKVNGGYCDEGIGLAYYLKDGKIENINCIQHETQDTCKEFFPEGTYSGCVNMLGLDPEWNESC